MRELKIMLAIMTAAILAAACGTAGTEDEPEQAAAPEETISQALPGADEVEIRVPESSTTTQALTAELETGTAALLGETAELYKFTRDISRSANGGVMNILLHIGFIVAHPPTSIENGYVIWGPWGEALSPVKWRLVAQLAREGRWAVYSLQVKPSDGDNEAFETALVGRSRRINQGKTGGFSINFDTLARINPRETVERGELHVDYDASGLLRSVQIHYENFVGRDENAPLNAIYRYQERKADQAGHFAFVARANVVEEGNDMELLVVLSRWNSDGRGRSDAKIIGGDLGQRMVRIHECWDEGFGRTFYRDSWNINPQEGDPADCALNEEEPPEDLLVE